MFILIHIWHNGKRFGVPSERKRCLYFMGFFSLFKQMRWIAKRTRIDKRKHVKLNNNKKRWTVCYQTKFARQKILNRIQQNSNENEFIWKIVFLWNRFIRFIYTICTLEKTFLLNKYALCPLLTSEFWNYLLEIRFDQKRDNSCRSRKKTGIHATFIRDNFVFRNDPHPSFWHR